MVRYSSRPRRSNRRSHYNKKRSNRMGPVVVIGVIVVAVLVFFFNNGNKNQDPNTVREPDINDVVNTMMSGQEDAEPRSVMQLPGSEPSILPPIKEPNAPRFLAAPKVQDMNAGANPEVQALVAQIMALYKSDSTKMIQVRKTLNKALQDMPMSPMQRMGIMEELEKLADIWLFGKTVYPDDPLCDTYMVKSGDNFERIGRNNDVPYQLLMRVNGVKKASSLQAGVPIKVVNGPFRAVVHRSTLTMDLYLGTTYVKTYVVGLGQPGKETPSGTWLVKERMVRPPYTDPVTKQHFEPGDPGYPIGSHYISIEGLDGEAIGRTGFAVHGTDKPQEIGMNTSSGCIRLRNSEIEEVYGLLAENKSKIQVEP